MGRVVGRAVGGSTHLQRHDLCGLPVGLVRVRMRMSVGEG